MMPVRRRIRRQKILGVGAVGSERGGPAATSSTTARNAAPTTARRCRANRASARRCPRRGLAPAAGPPDRSGELAVPHLGVEQRVGQIDEDVHGDDDDREEQGERQQDGVVAPRRRGDEVAADARNPRDGLDEERPGDDVRDQDAGDGRDRRERVPQRVPDDDAEARALNVP